MAHTSRQDFLFAWHGIAIGVTWILEMVGGREMCKALGSEKVQHNLSADFYTLSLKSSFISASQER